MDGDIAPLRELLSLCERYDAWLLVDDAHGFGVLGPAGTRQRGPLRHRLPPAHLHGHAGQGRGRVGRFVAGASELVEWLVQRGRSYIFTTAAPPMLACALLAALRLIAAEEWRRDTAAGAWLARLRDGLAGTGLNLLAFADRRSSRSSSAATRRRSRSASGCSRRVLWVPAIRPPTVPAGHREAAHLAVCRAHLRRRRSPGRFAARAGLMRR